MKGLYRHWWADPATIPEHVAYHHGAVVTRITMKKTEAGHWLIVVQARFRDSPKVAFVEDWSLADALESASYLASKGILTWLPDKWPPKLDSSGK